MKKSHFFRGICIYFLVCLALIFAVLTGLWYYLKSYEQSRPEAVLEAFLSSRDEDEWVEQLCSCILPTLTEFESADDIRAFVRDTSLGKGSITYALSNEGSDQTVYTVYSGIGPLADITLEPGESTGFGMNSWEVSHVDLRPISIDSSHTLTVIAPADAKVTVNGRDISGRDEYIDDSDIEYDGLSEYEKRFGYETPTRVRYCITGLYLEPTVSAGNYPLSVSDSYYKEYDHPGKGSYELSLDVPSGAIVTVSGLTPDADDLTVGDAEPGFEGLGDYVSEIPRRKTLHWTGLLFEPAVKVLDSEGRELTQDEKGRYILPVDRQLERKAGSNVEAFAKRYVNFCTNVEHDANASYEALTPYLIYGTPLQRRLYDAIDGFSWVYAAENTIHELYADNYRRYSDSVGCCDLRIHVSTHTPYETRLTDTTVRLILIRRYGEWKVAAMETIEQDS